MFSGECDAVEYTVEDHVVDRRRHRNFLRRGASASTTDASASACSAADRDVDGQSEPWWVRGTPATPTTELHRGQSRANQFSIGVIRKQREERGVSLFPDLKADECVLHAAYEELPILVDLQLGEVAQQKAGGKLLIRRQLDSGEQTIVKE